MRVRPLFNNVLIRKDKPVAVSAGGIIVPDSVATQYPRGVVVAAGSECKFAKEGHYVLFPKVAGQMTTVSGEELWIMSETVLFAILGDDPVIDPPVAQTEKPKRVKAPKKNAEAPPVTEGA